MKTLVLKQPHWHAGTQHAAGDRLTLDDITADWLVTRGKAALVPPARERRAEPAPESTPAARADD